MKKVSMQDIADQLGISRNSVSQALRNTDGVSEATKKAVIETAHSLGYEYREKQTNKQLGKILLIATTFVFSQKSFFGEIVDSIRKNCEKNGYQLVTESLSREALRTFSLPNNIAEYTGIIILSHSDNLYIKKIIDYGLPCVLVDHHDPSLHADAILSKNTDGTYHAISLLFQNNNKRIGFIGDTAFSPSYLERYQGYKQALADMDLVEDKSIEITSIEESQGALYTKLKEIETMPDAWFCANSGLAFMLNSYLQSIGYMIPDDINIICYDDTEFTRMASPPITNVSTNLFYMGEVTVRTLIKRIKTNDDPLIHKQILPTLNIRESVRIITQ